MVPQLQNWRYSNFIDAREGSSFTPDFPEKKLSIPAILCEARVAITPMNGKIRYGGTMEIGAVNSKVNMNG
jgi:D-amino-acid dehydrogenase